MTRYWIIDDTNPVIVYTGNWTTRGILDPASPEYNGTVHATNDPNATITLQAKDCTVLNAYGTLEKPGILGVPSSYWTVDTQSPFLFNSSRQVIVEHMDSITSHVKIYGSGKVAQGDHNITITLQGLTPDGPTFYFDYFAILTGDLVYVPDVILNDDSTQWTTPNWVNIETAGSYLNDIKVPMLNGNSTATVGFHGTEIVVYGSVNTTVSDDEVLGVFRIDEDQPHTVVASDLATPTSFLPDATPTLLENQIIWSTSGLNDIGKYQHKITIDVPPIPTMAWGIDYVIYGPSSAEAFPTPTETPPPPVASNKVNGGVVAGGVVGALVGITAIVLVIWFLRQRARRKAMELEPHQYVDERIKPAASVAPTVSSQKQKRSSTRKGLQPVEREINGNERGVRGRREMEGAGGPVFDISASSQQVTITAARSNESSSATMGPSTAQSAYDFVRPTPIREVDGGVRLATGNSEEDVVEILPPQYARY